MESRRLFCRSLEPSEPCREQEGGGEAGPFSWLSENEPFDEKGCGGLKRGLVHGHQGGWGVGGGGGGGGGD